MTKTIFGAVILAALFLFLNSMAEAQRRPLRKAAALPKVTAIDVDGLKTAIRPSGKPLIVNFWATWCIPCREEFPDLVRIAKTYKGRVDLITISLDDPPDITTAVPKFLSQMKAGGYPAYLLHTADEDAAITLIASDWNGSLPMTLLQKADGSQAYLRIGKLKPAILTDEIEKLLAADAN